MCPSFFHFFLIIFCIQGDFSSPTQPSLIEECLLQEFGEQKKLGDLEKLDLIILVGCLNDKHAEIIQELNQNYASTINTKDEKYDQLEKSCSTDREDKRVRQAIEIYEAEFGSYEQAIEYSENFNQTVPVFRKNKPRIKEISGYHERQAELRRQRWEHYLYHPPSDMVAQLARDIKTNYNVPEFAEGIARAYKRISGNYLEAASENIRDHSAQVLADELKTKNTVQILLSNLNLYEYQMRFSYDLTRPT